MCVSLDAHEHPWQRELARVGCPSAWGLVPHLSLKVLKGFAA